MRFSPKTFKLLVNFYPPYLGAGIKVDSVSKDWRELQVSMPLRWYNKNAVGTQFGGSLYSMVDPHLMILLMQLLGKKYLVWDKSAKICVSNFMLDEIKNRTKNGDKFFAHFNVEVSDALNELVAVVEKVIYIRKKQTTR